MPAEAGPKCPYESYAPRCNDGDPSNGYWGLGNVWIPRLIDNAERMRRQPISSSGGAVYYAPGVMEATAAYRGLSLDGYLGGVALMGCGQLGESVWIRRPGLALEGPYLVADCARLNDYWPIIKGRGEVIEVDWQTWARWGYDGSKVRVVVATDPFSKAHTQYEPVDFPAWALGLLEEK